MIDYETDPRPFSECLKDFAVRINGGKQYGSRPLAAHELRVSPVTLNAWMDGRGCGNEASMRRLMTFVINAK